MKYFVTFSIFGTLIGARGYIRNEKPNRQLIHAVCKANPNTVVILHAGAPVEMDWETDAAAILHGYLGGQAGAGAMLDIKKKKECPCEKLAETYPIKYEDTPSFSY